MKNEKLLNSIQFRKMNKEWVPSFEREEEKEKRKKMKKKQHEKIAIF